MVNKNIENYVYLIYNKVKGGGVKMNDFIMYIPLIINLFIFIPIFALSIYMFIVFIKLAKKASKALDVYISKNDGGEQ